MITLYGIINITINTTTLFCIINIIVAVIDSTRYNVVRHPDKSTIGARGDICTVVHMNVCICRPQILKLVPVNVYQCTFCPLPLTLSAPNTT